ncbi:MAG: permease [Burkholderiales bacterium RIFOXYC12_FULL_65_23]|uniref:DMT family transporter n=1 Tax=Malikia spinosa TaxID=86180 RepID=UPI0008D2CDAF|nr:DMT family transporter [Malikia spinosa]OGB72009.1 MAG: permease [Burkholderiales bacterium RIFOXYC12_FULL_65_23]
MKSDLLALAAIALWGTLATLGVELAHVPPFLLTGLGLLAGSLIALPLSRLRLQAWKVPLPTLLVGIYGLFGFHWLLFLALRHAPAVEANLINYLWPLGMVVLAPLFLPGVRLHGRHVMAALLGFAGAAIAILGRGGEASSSDSGFQPGYLLALASAFVWASYSLLTRRVPAFPTAAVGSFALVSGLLSLACHALLEPATALSAGDVALIALLGLGPLGGAFFLWDAAIKCGDPRRIGLLAFITPLLSTALLLLSTGQALRWNIALAAALVVGAAVWGSRSPQR